MDLEKLRNELLGRRISVQEKPWESVILKTKVYTIQFLNEPNTNEIGKIKCGDSQSIKRICSVMRENPPSMLTTRVSTKDYSAIRALEESDFNLMECYIELDHELRYIPKRRSALTIRPFNRCEISEIERIAYNSFLFSRFHMDERISQGDANKTRSEWVKNACLGNADAVLVAAIDDRLVGFVICRNKTANCDVTKIGGLDLIAVHHDFRKKGIGFELTVEFLNYCKKNAYSKATVGTQAHNIPSIQLYQKTGFLMVGSSYSYHLHYR